MPKDQLPPSHAKVCAGTDESEPSPSFTSQPTYFKNKTESFAGIQNQTLKTRKRCCDLLFERQTPTQPHLAKPGLHTHPPALTRGRGSSQPQPGGSPRGGGATATSATPVRKRKHVHFAQFKYLANKKISPFCLLKGLCHVQAVTAHHRKDVLRAHKGRC